MSDSSERTFTGDFRRFFLRGLVVLLPSVLTLWIVVKAYQFVDNTIAEPINRSVRVAMINTARVWEPLRVVYDPTPEAIQAEWRKIAANGGKPPTEEELRSRLRGENIGTWWRDHWYMDLIGIVIAIIAVYIAGRLLGGFFGRQIYRRIEGFITTLPVFKQVYPYVKQIVDFLFSDDQPIKFNRVVAVEYPRKGLRSVGVQTGPSLRTLTEQAGDAVTIFIPSSPTPFTGYTITVLREEVIDLPMTVDEAVRFAVSGGVLVPTHQTVDEPDTLGQTGLRPLPGPTPPIPPADSASRPGSATG